jgi:hypothetical protein
MKGSIVSLQNPDAQRIYVIQKILVKLISIPYFITTGVIIVVVSYNGRHDIDAVSVSGLGDFGDVVWVDGSGGL